MSYCGSEKSKAFLDPAVSHLLLDTGVGRTIDRRSCHVDNETNGCPLSDGEERMQKWDAAFTSDPDPNSIGG